MAGSVARASLALLRARRSELVDLLATLVGVPSHISQPDGLVRMAELVGTELRHLGFTEVPAPRNEAKRAPDWAARILSPDVAASDLPEPALWVRAGSPTKLLVLGDLDAALASSPSACRLAVRDGRAYGPAIADMKGGLTVLVGALQALRASGVPSPTISVILSADEQAGSLRSREIIATIAAESDWVVCLECAREGGRLMVSRGHIGVGRLVASGRESHAGSARDVGINAIWRLAHGLLALEADGVSLPQGFVTPTILAGGRRRSIVPGEASAILDVRARDQYAWTQLEGRMREALGTLRSAHGLTLDVYSHRPGLERTEQTDRFLRLVRGTGEEMGLEVDAVDSMAAGSSAFVDASRVPVLDGMGPEGTALMTPQEHIMLDSIAERAALLAGTVARIAAA